MAAGHAIRTVELSVRYGAKAALDRLSLRLPIGGIHALVGANGAGKSTLFRVLLGFQQATGGTAEILGQPSDRLDPAARARIGVVGDDHALAPWLRVTEIADLQQAHYAARWDEPAFAALLANFDVRADQRVADLSRGERAGLNLALALGQNPELLILDEPTLGLDVVAKKRLLDALVSGVIGAGRTIIYCSHHIDEVERLADTLVLLERGRLLSHSAPDAFCERVQQFVADVPFQGSDPASLPGLLTHRRGEHVHRYWTIDQDERFAERLRAAGARRVEILPVSLEEAVDAVLTRSHAEAVDPLTEEAVAC